MLTSSTEGWATLDPGQHACGVSLWRGPELVRAGAVRRPDAVDREGPGMWAAMAVLVELWLAGSGVERLVVETMKQYAGTGRARPEDLLELAGVAGAVVGRLAIPAVGAKAAEWNGQVPSAIRRARTQAWVTERGWSDRVNLNTTARFQQDVWSAIGIGRWWSTGRR